MEVGSLVRLRSGSPLLTILSIQAGIAHCSWFNLDSVQDLNFGEVFLPLAALKEEPPA